MGAADKLYNGNIAETFWSTATDGGFVRNYGYKYDSLNRLKDATYQKSGQLTGMYNENLSYDKNGNIMNLSRYGDRDEQYLPIQIDNLGYTYATNSNKLLNVADTSNNTSGFNDFNKTGDDYVYDANGNLITDKNKKITAITYNHLNLPTQITFGTTGNIVYIYTASGQKVKKVVTSTTPASVVTTDYLGGYQYSNSSLQFFPTAEGYVKNTPVSGINTYSYVFNYTDHLGNVRLSYTKYPSTNALDIIEENNYYPFGLKHNGYNPISPAQEYKYKYNGKELQDELSLNLYDYGAMMYDPAIGRRNNIDPKAEESRRWSTYSYCYNDPMRFVDSDGMSPDDVRFRDNDGKLIATYKTDKIDVDVNVPVTLLKETNIDLNKILDHVDLEDIDIVGVGFDFDFTAVMGGGKAIESVAFLDGKDSGKSETFVTTRQNVGWNGGVGVYAIAGDYYDDKNLKTTDYTGASFALSAGVAGGPILSSYSKFWSPKDPANDGSGFKSLFNPSLRAWSGYNIGGGAGAGAQWSKQNTTIYNHKKK